VSGQHESPFAVLQIAPTADVAAVKRAYFSALARHPPHADPDAFRRVRTAYETLMAPGGLAAAIALAPPDPKHELARYRQRFDSALAEAATAAQQSTADSEAGARFKQALMRLSLDEAITAFAVSR
jgi:hypothetical protein